MKTFQRICISNFTIQDTKGNKLELERGKEYITGEEENGKCVVFSNFWANVPVNIFAGEMVFTK